MRRCIFRAVLTPILWAEFFWGVFRHPESIFEDEHGRE